MLEDTNSFGGAQLIMITLASYITYSPRVKYRNGDGLQLRSLMQNSLVRKKYV